MYIYVYICLANIQDILFHNYSLLQPEIDEGTIRNITTRYTVEYPDSQCANKSSLSAPITIPANSPVQYLMQNAAAQFGWSFLFSVSYFGSELGYSITTLNGSSNNIENNCSWTYFIGFADGRESEAKLGISNYRVPADGYSITWSFMQIEEPAEMPDNSIVSCMMPMHDNYVHTYMLEYSFQNLTYRLNS